MLLLTMAGRSEIECFLSSLAVEVKPKGKDVNYYRRELSTMKGKREKNLVKKITIMEEMQRLKEKLSLVIDEIQQDDEKIRKKEIKLQKALMVFEMEGQEQQDDNME